MTIEGLRFAVSGEELKQHLTDLAGDYQRRIATCRLKISETGKDEFESTAVACLKDSISAFERLYREAMFMARRVKMEETYLLTPIELREIGMMA